MYSTKIWGSLKEVSANLHKLLCLSFARTQQRFEETNEMKADTVPFWIILLGFAKKVLNTEPNISSDFNLTFIQLQRTVLM